MYARLSKSSEQLSKQEAAALSLKTPAVLISFNKAFHGI